MRKLISILIVVIMLSSATSYAETPDFYGFDFQSQYEDLRGQIDWELAGYYPGIAFEYYVWYHSSVTEEEPVLLYDVFGLYHYPQAEVERIAENLKISDGGPIIINKKILTLENGWDILVQRMEQFDENGDPLDIVPESVSAQDQDEVRMLLENVDLFCSGFKAVEYTAPGAVGSTIDFTSTDLDGNTVTSADIFKDYSVTMINVWATWCPPCKAELPELAKLNKEFSKKNSQIIGVCLDADGELATAKKLTKDSCYVNIAGKTTSDFDWANACEAIPTSFFVDSEGRILIEPVVGAMVEQYSISLDEALGLTE